jgi:hypothetical protein
MKQYFLLLVIAFLCVQAKAQVKISEMTTTNADPTGGWIPVVLGANNYKIDAGKFYNKLDSIYKKPGTDSIFTLKNGVAKLAFVDSGGCCAEGPFIPQKTIAELRALTITPTTGKVYYIIDNGKQGMFRYSGDYSQSGAGTLDDWDDGVMTIVTANNKKFKRITEDHVNVKWFGAIGNGGSSLIKDVIPTYAEAQKVFDKYLFLASPSADKLSLSDYNTQTMDWLAIQSGINYCVWANDAANYANGEYRKLYVPGGNYHIKRELLVANWRQADTLYRFATITIEGEGSFHSASGSSVIVADFNRTFALGIQRGKGCKIKNLTFLGQFKHIKTNGSNEEELLPNRQFFDATLDNYTSLYDNSFYGGSISADRVFGPYSAIVIDPFRNKSINGFTPAEQSQFYTELSHKYRGEGDKYKPSGRFGGSTGTEMEDISIANFVAGIVFSPNGETKNNELSRVDKARIDKVKAAVVICQEQEKTNIIKHLECWLDVHTVILGSHYGQQAPGQWKIEDVNLAGRVNQFAYRNEGGWFPLFVENFFSESLGKLGYLKSQVGGSFENAEIGLHDPVSPDLNLSFPGYLPKWALEGGGFTFKNCNIRYYGSFLPVSVKGDFKFENCVFETVPYFSLNNDYKVPSFINCQTASEGSFGYSGIKASYPGYFHQNVAYGNFILKDYNFDPDGIKQQFRYENHQPFREVGYISNVQITSLNANGEADIPVTQANYDKYYKFARLVLVNDPNAVADGYHPLGIIRSYNPVTQKLNVGGIRSTTSLNTNLEIMCMLPVTTINPFMGDMTAGVSEISNVRLDVGAANYNFGAASPSQLVGQVIMLKDAPAAYRNYKDFAVIYGYNSATNTLLLSDVSVYSTKQGIYFCNGCEKLREQKINANISDNEIMPRGSKVSAQGAQGPKEYLVTKTGVYNVAGVAVETRAAEMVPAFNYNNHADARFYDSRNIYFTSVTDANGKIVAADRKRGMNVLVLNGSMLEEYWYKDGVADANLIKKRDIASIAAPTAAIANTETQVVGTTIAPNTLAAGDIIRVTAYGIQTNTATASTSVYRFRIGTTTLTGSIAASSSWPNGSAARTNIIVKVTADVLVTSVSGATATLIGQVDVNKGYVSGTSPVGVTAAVTVNPTVANIAEFTFISGATSTTHTFHSASIEIIKK